MNRGAEGMERERVKPRTLKPSVKRLIYTRAIREKNTPREFLANELIREIEEIGEIPPSFETAKRYISKARNAKNPIDKLWTLACCSDYASFFPPEYIPVLIDCKEHLRQIDDGGEYLKYFGVPISDISIRTAIWLVRLNPLIEHLSPKLMIDNEPLPSTFPFVIANTYSMAEMASEILGEDHFDSSDLDNALFSGDINTFMKIAGIIFLSTAKPCHNNSNCESCDYVKLPGFNFLCTPKLKDGSK